MPAPADRIGAGVSVNAEIGRATDENESQDSSEASVPTAISATASPPQQVVGHDVTITGQLTASDAPVAGAPVRLYVEVAELWSKISETTTNEAGTYAFRVHEPTAETSTFKVVFPGSANHKPSMSEELAVTYVAIPTTITAAAIPPQQFIGQSVAIKGQLSASGAPLGDVYITLYIADDVIERVSVATTTTDTSGAYQFTLNETAPGQHSYVVHAPGTGTHASAESAPVSVAYVAIPTTITAVVSPREQCVGHDVTITGRLTADSGPLANAPVILYNAGDVAQRAPAAETTTDDAGYYQFHVKDITPGRRSYVVQAPARGTYAPAQHPEIAVAHVAIPTAITATATARQKKVTITGQLTAGGTPLADTPVTLYNADDVAQNVPVAETKTNDSGSYEFHPLTETTAAGNVYRVHYAGDNAHTSAQSTDVLVHHWTPSIETPPVIVPVAAPRSSSRLARAEVVLLVVAAIIVAVAIFVMLL